MITKTKWQITGLAGLNALLVFAHTAQAAPLEYVIDPAATKTTYETKYLGFITVRGIFTRMTGALQYDREPDATKPMHERVANIHVVIDATTLKPTNFDSESKRQMLRGPEFFNVEKFPTIEFKSNKFRYQTNSQGEEKLVAIDGMVKLVGQTKPTTLTVIKSQCDAATTIHPARCTATTEWIVKRFEYGMNGWANTVSDEVKISVELVAVAANSTASNDKK